MKQIVILFDKKIDVKDEDGKVIALYGFVLPEDKFTFMDSLLIPQYVKYLQICSCMIFQNRIPEIDEVRCSIITDGSVSVDDKDLLVEGRKQFLISEERWQELKDRSVWETADVSDYFPGEETMKAFFDNNPDVKIQDIE